MAKKAATSSFFTFSAVLVPLLLIGAAAIFWFASTQSGSNAPSGPSAGFVSRLGDVRQADAEAIRGLASAVQREQLTGEAAQRANELVRLTDSLVAFDESVVRAEGVIEKMLSATDFDESSTIADFRQRLSLLATRLQALRGGADSLEQQSAAIVIESNDIALLAAALNGDNSDLDVAALADSDLSAVLVDDTFVLRNAAEVIQSESSSMARAVALIDGFPVGATGARSAPSGLMATLAPLMPWLPIGMLGLALLLIGVLLTGFVRDAHLRRAALEQADQNERNQQAILRLLDELGSLADGDLTVEATVTEDITGAIADSINYAIEALRELVTTIDGTAAMVDSATRQTESTAVHMNRSAQKQALEIAAATESITAIAASIEEVSGNAERSSDVARHSVDVAHKGGDAVRRTIEGMNTIRETIQDTSKRIKRLGESSQEIGNIVELINDIAEQTNILALNASIQASMAGEAGRGFAVVADEVQRLAERSTNATKQIEVLVRTIQADTNEAVVSMERSTTDVVGGALLAENAGAALDEIEQVSNQIASLVQNIYSSARQQSKAASDINRRTVALREISGQTGKATSATTSSIAKLAQLAGELRKSVSGFRLPESASVTRLTRSADKVQPADEAREVG
ncbi:MAG: methyl-accepting chemotaxis protein [Pseudomonadota bacterium]